MRAQIARYLHQIRGVRCSPDQIVIGAGTYHSLDLLFQLLKEDVKTLALESAVNDGVKALLAQYSFAHEPLRLEDDGVCLEDVANSKAQAIYLTPSHQFPYGMTLSSRKRAWLLDWARRTGGYLIENDYDGEFRYDARQIPSLQSEDDNGRVVYIGTFSRVLCPSIRLSYLVLPPALLDRFLTKSNSYDQYASPIFQKTLYLFMESGDFHRHVRKMRALYKHKHDVLLQALQEHFSPDDGTITGTGAGLHMLLRLHTEQKEEKLIEKALRQGVKVYPTSAYSLLFAPSVPPTILFGFGGLSEEEIREGVKRFAQAVSN
ncbi:GntR family transcriptional regulator [Brevibacillus parabrevis]|nr:GntR family transcriptional regulator [Brevibacillus parabrevis]